MQLAPTDSTTYTCKLPMRMAKWSLSKLTRFARHSSHLCSLVSSFSRSFWIWPIDRTQTLDTCFEVGFALQNEQPSSSSIMIMMLHSQLSILCPFSFFGRVCLATVCCHSYSKFGLNLNRRLAYLDCILQPSRLLKFTARWFVSSSCYGEINPLRIFLRLAE